MRKNQKRTKIALISFALLTVLIAAFALGCVQNGDKPSEGSNTVNVTGGDTGGEKKITVEIVFSESNKKTIEINTKSEYLRGALEEKSLISGTESSYGLYVTKVDGVTADEAKKQWWCFTKNGEAVMTGVDVIPIKDGDKFEITLSVY